MTVGQLNVSFEALAKDYHTQEDFELLERFRAIPTDKVSDPTETLSFLAQWRAIKNNDYYHNFFHDYISVHYTETVQPTCDLQCYEQKVDYIFKELQGSDASVEERELIMSQLYAYLTGWSDPYVKASMRNWQLKLISSEV